MARLTISQRIKNALRRSENTLNLSFKIKDIHSMTEKFKIKEETDGVDKLTGYILKEILH